jgi:hypothetical protein
MGAFHYEKEYTIYIMQKQIVWFVVLIFIVAAGWYLLPTQKTVIPPSLSQDLYPLYDTVGWNAALPESVPIGTTTYLGASITSSPVTDTMNPGAVFTPFETYYDKKLKSLGWSVANDLAAGGHVGGQTGYRKGDQVILTRFQIEYHTKPDNAPSECPCDVSLSLFSTEQ